MASDDPGGVITHPPIALELPLKLLLREAVQGGVLLSYHSPRELARRYELTQAEADPLGVVETVARHIQHTS